MNCNRPALLIIAAVLSLALVAWTQVSAAPVTDPPACPPGLTCEPLPTPPPPPMPGAVFLPFAAGEEYP